MSNLEDFLREVSVMLKDNKARLYIHDWIYYYDLGYRLENAHECVRLAINQE